MGVRRGCLAWLTLLAIARRFGVPPAIVTDSSSNGVGETAFPETRRALACRKESSMPTYDAAVKALGDALNGAAESHDDKAA